MRKIAILMIISMFIIAIPPSQAQPEVPDPPEWTIGWVENQSADIPLEMSKDPQSSNWWDKAGTVTLEFYIDNTRPVEVSVNLDLENDHEDDFEWVEFDLDENVKVAGGTNKTFSVTLSAGSLNKISAGTTHTLRVIATEESQIPTASQNIEANTEVPRVSVMLADIIDDDVPLLAGSDAEVVVELRNMGNQNDRLDPEMTKLTVDGCPQLTAETMEELSAVVPAGGTADGAFAVQASSSHSSKECTITLKATSDGGASVSDSLALEVLSSSDSRDDESSNGGGNSGVDPDAGGESENDGDVKGNFLPSLGLPETLLMALGAAFIMTCSRRLQS